jgi:hypothetical protein
MLILNDAAAQLAICTDSRASSMHKYLQQSLNTMIVSLMSPPRIELRCAKPARLAWPIRVDPALIWLDVIFIEPRSATIVATTVTTMPSVVESKGGFHVHFSVVRFEYCCVS